MDIIIDSKKNNPLLNRTEVRFTINHEGEKTPNREIIRSELAESLNAKKENIIINNINSSFGIQQSKGYAKIYSSQKTSENIERKYILKRNKLIKKVEKKKGEQKVPQEKPIEKEETIKEESEKTAEKIENKEDSNQNINDEKKVQQSDNLKE